jgi:hypothetical protein
MSIIRLHFKEGHPLSSLESRVNQLQKILEENYSFAVALGPGVFNLTPEWWKKNYYVHMLTVFDSGKGLYRAIPKSKNVVLKELPSEKTISRGPMEVRIPEDQSAVVIAGPSKDGKSISLFEFIFYETI